MVPHFKTGVFAKPLGNVLALVLKMVKPFLKQ
jgi:hypothetical protein